MSQCRGQCTQHTQNWSMSDRCCRAQNSRAAFSTSTVRYGIPFLFCRCYSAVFSWTLPSMSSFASLVVWVASKCLGSLFARIFYPDRLAARSNSSSSSSSSASVTHYCRFHRFALALVSLGLDAG
ncbi:hypothetical protein BCV70DRAFT_202901 [Testicularia cyperi]|uniref:Uncharacterized protein n=1 Tax=Testicularia cyperi TaxID=1882483 RepID=A0A317XGH1_9BASI|nr:hypothetical protein BCV70DRAFT_202901 [Testicularia cyperi]